MLNYYLTDYISYILFFIATYMLANDNKYGFIVFSIGDVFLLIFGCLSESTGTVISSIIFIIVNTHAFYIKTKKSKNKTN